MDQDELAGCLRAWRDRLAPAEAGLPGAQRRGPPGLRREEVAGLAGVSVDYLARLEQGRAETPSPLVVSALARALRLTDDERDHLFRAAGLASPEAGAMRHHLTPGVQRVLDRLGDVAVVVIDGAGQVVATNPLGAALVGDFTGLPERERNVVWRHFAGLGSRVVFDEHERDAREDEMVLDLHEAVGHFPDDLRLRALVDDLQRLSPRFAALWERRPVATRAASRRTIDHPEAGRLTFDCDALHVGGSDLRLIVYTAAPGSPEADALAAIGPPR